MEPTSLRERKKAKTYDQISEVAQTLFAKQGYDETTLEEIAAAADVHKRTLLRYFPSKAHLVLHRRVKLLEDFKEAVADRDKISVLDVWRDHVVMHAAVVTKRGDRLNTTRLADDVPELNRELMHVQSEYRDIIQEALAAEFPDHPDGELISHVAAAALVGGNFSLAAACERRHNYAGLDKSLLRIIEIVRKRLLKR